MADERKLCADCLAHVHADPQGEHACPVAGAIERVAENVDKGVEWHWYATACPYYMPRSTPEDVSGMRVLDAVAHLDLAEKYVEDDDDYQSGYECAMDARAILLSALDTKRGEAETQE